MITDSSIEIDAPPATVWAIFTDAPRWPEWTESVTSVEALDGHDLAVGNRFAIKQPGLPKVAWKVTAVAPGRSWTWTYTAPGNRTSASHELVDQGDGRTLVRQRIDQQGAIGAFVGALMRRRTRRFLDLESRGLKARCEGAHRDGAPT